MKSYLAVFLCSLILSLFLTPLARSLGKRFGVMDIPSARKSHDKPKPRTGGTAIVLSFFATLTLSFLLNPQAIPLGRQEIFLLIGTILCFLVGFIDDLHRLNALTKLTGQILAVTIAFYGGIRIDLLPFVGIEIPTWLSYFLTLFWFLLFINAINLIDGLDGLAAGISLFTSLLLVIISALRGEYSLVLAFSALSGTLFGFLRYNFNPSTIFMGDGGSYFLGYIISGLAVYGSAKGQVGAVFMIPFIGMGVPIFDTLTTPIRRFIRGRKMFSPDNRHIHHKLIAMGLTTRRAVLSLYLFTSILCIATIAAVNIHDELIGFIIVIAALAMLFLYRKTSNKALSLRNACTWLKDVADATGISKDRRMFLDMQLEMGQSQSVEDLWSKACTILKYYSIDFAELRLKPQAFASSFLTPQTCTNTATESHIWQTPRFERQNAFNCEGLLKLELPLTTQEGEHLGSVWIIKDILKNPPDQQFFMRLEQFRRTLVSALATRP